MDRRHKEVLDEAQKAFADRRDLESLWQEEALAFYPEMADFTMMRSQGEDFASHLTTSYPIIARRTLGDAFSALLRPTNIGTASPGVWFNMRTSLEEEDTESRRWLDDATGIMRRAMYDRDANFVRATKQGDHSFATWGQCPISVEFNRERNALLYRSWHLKNVAWREDFTGQIDTIYRKWKPTASVLQQVFRDRIAEPVKRAIANNERHKPVECMHIVVPGARWESRAPFVSLWIDVDNQHIIEERGSASKIYVIPRWVTVPGSQYAMSPAVVAALPDARLLQAMTLSLLEAAEKYADPPIIAKEEVIRTDIQLFAGGTTFVDYEEGGRVSDALMPLYHPTAGQGTALGLEMRADVRDSIARAFFLDSLSLPPADVRDMTAFEVGQRISEWIRRAMPIFEPMEFDYNGQLCEETFGLLMRNGAFGPLDDIPQSIRGAEVDFRFESPLHENAERQKGQKFLEAKAALVQAAELDPSVVPMVNANEALRDILSNLVPADWTRSDAELEEIQRAREAEQQAQQAMAGFESLSKSMLQLSQAEAVSRGEV